jgi:SAM-dependent methyltransferase
MGKQSDIFLNGEGDAWLRRNEHKIDVKNDPVLELLRTIGLIPKSVLEIGCADGWRLREIDKMYRCQCHGIDPGASRYGGNNAFVEPGDASDLATCFNEDYDLVIMGFCLYLCDREDLFRIVMEADRVLEDGGHLIVYDFLPLRPHSREYAHKTGVFTYKMNYANLWLGNPAYTSLNVTIQNPTPDMNEATSVALLKKDVKAGWPCKSF